MQSFLEETAEYILSTYDGITGDLCIVLPNKRASLFLKTHFSKLIDQPLWLPDVFGAEDFIEELSELEVIDNLTQLFELYHVHKNEKRDEAEPLEEFIKWGQIMLHDFNEVDRYMIPASRLFGYVNEARAMEVWNTGGEELTEFQKKYLAFWEELGQYYEKYTSHLISSKKAYQGLAFRKVAEKIEKDPEAFVRQSIPWKKVIFTGFNALTSAEEKIMKLLEKEGKAEILWDIDRYYYDNPLHEAGLFLRRHIKKRDKEKTRWFSNHLSEEPKKINIIGVPKKVGQAKITGELLGELNDDEGFRETAVVLADESLLMPLLQSLPEKVDSTNITMGLPLKNTAVYAFYEAFFKCLNNREKMDKSGKGIYHRDLIHFLQQPHMTLLFPRVRSLIGHIIEHNLIFISEDKFMEMMKKHSGDEDITKHTWIYPRYGNAKDLLEQCFNYLEQLKQKFGKDDEKEENIVETEALFIMAKVFNQLRQFLERFEWMSTAGTETLYHVLKQISSTETIPFYGEPLRGLQIMGMLETRVLDFKNIILISANEGVLPGGKSGQSFIPYDIKRAFHLPTHTEKDAVYAYHFYHLLQRVNNISILYDADMDSFGKGEQSRFIKQVVRELPRKNTGVRLKQSIANVKVNKTEERRTEIPKTEGIINSMKTLLEYGISPSALATYVKCPLDFYYKYVLGLRETEEVEETVEASSMGEFMHNALEVLYRPYLNKPLQAKHIEAMKNLADEVIRKEFLKQYESWELKYGKNLISLEMAVHYLQSFLNKEKNTVRKKKQLITVKSLEQKLSGTMQLRRPVEGIGEIKLKGKADRIDKFGNELRVIDYKTGNVMPADLSVKEPEEVFTNGKKDKCLQLLLYGWLATKSYPEEENIKPGILSFRKLGAGYLNISMGKEKILRSEILEDFEAALSEFIEGMLDRSVPFRHNPDSEYCRFCGEKN